MSSRMKALDESAAKFYFPSTYPALNVVPPVFSFQVEWVGLTIPAGEAAVSASSFPAFIQGVKKQAMKKLVPYTFFNTKNHDQSLAQISESCPTRILSQTKLSIKSGEKNVWEEKNPEGLRFTAELQPMILDENRVECRVNLVLEKAGANLFWQSTRLVFNKGQTVAVTGLRQILEGSLGDKREMVKTMVVFSPMASASDEEMILLLTPDWNARE